MPEKLLIATGNPGKMREYAELLSGLPFELVSLKDLDITHEVDETGETFAENAWLKASEYAVIAGLLTLADDSGLEVAALSGDPGVRSARYGGDAFTSDEDRVELLLKNMKDVPWEERGAHFKCVISIAQPKSPLYERGGREGDFDATLVTQAEGFVAGMIQYKPQGENGFGYDPVFYIPEFDQTAAQLSPDVKNQISHRAKAAEIVVESLKNLTSNN